MENTHNYLTRPTLSRHQVVDLRSLFSFDKLRESGRVRVITTEEFLEKEALTGNLGIQPSEDVKRLNVEVGIDWKEHCTVV